MLDDSSLGVPVRLGEEDGMEMDGRCFPLFGRDTNNGMEYMKTLPIHFSPKAYFCSPELGENGWKTLIVFFLS